MELFTKVFVLCFVLLGSLLLTEGVPRRGYYNNYDAGVGGGGYAHVSGGSAGYNGRPNRGFYGPPRGGYSSGHSSGGLHAKGGFVAGGGSVSGGYNKGYNRGFRG